MWAEELLMIEKMVTSLQNPSAHISGKLPTYLEKPPPSEKNARFGREKRSKIMPIFLYGLVTYITAIFLKKMAEIGQSYPQQCQKDFTPAYMVLPPPTR